MSRPKGEKGRPLFTSSRTLAVHPASQTQCVHAVRPDKSRVTDSRHDRCYFAGKPGFAFTSSICAMCRWVWPERKINQV